jgi:hypothetical protein
MPVQDTQETVFACCDPRGARAAPPRGGCVFRSQIATAVGGTRPVIPGAGCHPCRLNAATASGGTLPPAMGVGGTRDADLPLAVCCAVLAGMREEQMPAQRLSMRPLRAVLRLQWACGLSERKIAQSLRVRRPTGAASGRRAPAAGLAWPLPASRDDRLLAPQRFATTNTPMARRPRPDWAAGPRERKRPGVTWSLVWHAYQAIPPEGRQDRQFCAA